MALLHLYICIENNNKNKLSLIYITKKGGLYDQNKNKKLPNF